MKALWLAAKHFQTSWFRIKLILLTMAVITADFTILFMLIKGWSSILMGVLIFILTFIALSTTLLHLIKSATYDIGVFKALGAKSRTITVSILFELVLIGITGTTIGVAGGVVFLWLISLLTPLNPLSLIAPIEVFGLLILSCILGMLAGITIAVVSAWRKSQKSVMEILTHAK